MNFFDSGGVAIEARDAVEDLQGVLQSRLGDVREARFRDAA